MTDAHKAEAERLGLPLQLCLEEEGHIVNQRRRRLTLIEKVEVVDMVNQHFDLVEQVERLRAALKVYEKGWSGGLIAQDAIKETEPK